MERTLRNNTLSDIILEDLGEVTIAPAEVLTVDPYYYLEYANSEEVLTLVDSKDLVVGDGQTELNPELGKSWLRLGAVASATVINQSGDITNNYPDNTGNVQGALEWLGGKVNNPLPPFILSRRVGICFNREGTFGIKREED